MDESSLVFGWDKWPFRIVADAEFARVWADRATLRQEIDRRLRRLNSLPHSTVQIIWADFGAGKSHTLRHLEARCLDEGDGILVPLYTEVPVGTEGLLDLYRSLVGAIPENLIEKLAEGVKRGVKRTPGSSGARDLRQALKLLASEDSNGRSLALDWLQASSGVPYLKALKAYGINARIEDDTRVVEILTEFIRLMRDVRKDAVVIWLIDEFQRVADVPQRKRDAFSKSIVSLFNSCPAGLHFVLSFSVAQQSTALALIPPDLRSRASTFPMLMLPHLTGADCMEFSRDLFDAFRTTPRQDREYPFTVEALESIVGDLEASTSGAVTPRLLMERLEAVLFELYDASGGKPSLPLPADQTLHLLKAIRARNETSS